MACALGYQPALSSATALPRLPMEEEAGLNLHHKAGTARSLMRVSALKKSVITC